MLHRMTKQKIKGLTYFFGMQKNKKISIVGNKTRLLEKTGAKDLEE